MNIPAAAPVRPKYFAPNGIRKQTKRAPTAMDMVSYFGFPMAIKVLLFIVLKTSRIPLKLNQNMDMDAL